MEALELELTYPDKSRYRLTDPLSVTVEATLESPARAMTARFPLRKGELPAAAVGAAVLRGGRRVFEGLCDQQTAREDSTGRTLTLQARSRGGLLLDNEALPQTYYNVTAREIFRGHIQPYGFSRFVIPRDYTAGLFTVPKGMSEWEVLCAFCMRFYARYPVIGEGDTVVVEERGTQPRARITNRPGEEGLRYLQVEDTQRRASVISELLLRDKKGNYSRVLENPFGNPWQVRRRRYVIPAAEYATTPLADGWQQLQRAQRGAHVAEVVLPGWAGLWPGDCVELDTGGLARQGRMTVWRCRWEVSGRGEYTTLTLTVPGVS